MNLTYSDFPCHLKVNKDKLLMMMCNPRWKCKKNSARRPDEKIPFAPGTNQIAGFIEFPAPRAEKKTKTVFDAYSHIRRSVFNLGERLLSFSFNEISFR